MALPRNRVYCVKCPAASYGGQAPTPAPELPPEHTTDTAERAVRYLFAEAGLDKANIGASDWNPLGDLIGRGNTVLIKPNWVTHHNNSGQGLNCLVTHTSVIEAILTYVVKARPRRVIVGDAPIQGCDFHALSEACGFGRLTDRFGAVGVDLSVRDFRRTTLGGPETDGVSRPTGRVSGDYVLFDLGADSELEPISAADARFRVTMYNPDLLKRTHGPGRHQYLVAREAIDADVVINVPKLKTHKKAGITGALKNLVGINGLKDYLPHHRKGGSAQGGDCYEGRSRLKAFREQMLDAANRSDRPALKRLYRQGNRLGLLLGRSLGVDEGLEGSWFGNDTVWRMCLDLQRILHYGRDDGTLGAERQRTVLTITDAIIAGEGEGPMAPTPVPLGLMTMGLSTAAVEWAHALLMGLDPRRIPLVREAFAPHRYPLVDFGPDDVVIEAHGRCLEPDGAFTELGRPFRAPSGWRGHCERAGVGVRT